MSDNHLLDKIQSGAARVVVMGMGYVGMPLARSFARGGLSVIGYDVDKEKVKKLNAGQSYIQHIPSSFIAEMRAKGRFVATSNPADLKRGDAIIICVPTPLSKTRDPDMTYVIKTAETIAGQIRRDQLVVLESTTYPGTTREVVKPIIERSGLKAGKDFFLAFSPEREDPGRKDFTTETIPKVVGGLEPRSMRLAVALYSKAIKAVVPVSSCEVAEAAKIVENVYRLSLIHI